jgi:hypothetical protein
MRDLEQGGTGLSNQRRSSFNKTTRFHPECPQYEAAAGSKRCKHYVDGGACALPSQFMCVEWLAANGHPVRQASTMPPARAPFRLEAQQAPAASPTTTAPATPPKPPVPAVPAAPAIDVALSTGASSTPIPASDIASFKALGVEVQLDVGGGAVHLVPAYTKQDRIELSVEHAATLRRLLDAFPGARIARFARTTTSEEIRHG